jgi:hypothetical protein
MFEPVDFLLLARNDEPVPDEVLASLEAAWNELSMAYERLDPERTLVQSNKPGYLTTNCEEWQVFVPWCLVTSFPGPSILHDLLRVGASVAVEPVTNICVSGSTAGLGRDVEIGDIDFCQYTEFPPAQIVARAVRFTESNGQEILIRARYGNRNQTTAEAPWSDSWPRLTDVMSKVSDIPSSERFMLDFLGKITRFGVLPISTVVLAADFDNREIGAAGRSFVYQEAAAVPTATASPPWGLVDPGQISEFITFLRDQVSSYSESDLIKAVKRGLMLANTIRLHELGDEGLDILLSPACKRYVREKRRKELEEITARYDKREWLSSQEVVLKPANDIQHTVGEIEPSAGGEPEPTEGQTGVAELPKRCLEFVRKLEETLNELERQLDLEVS